MILIEQGTTLGSTDLAKIAINGESLLTKRLSFVWDDTAEALGLRLDGAELLGQIGYAGWTNDAMGGTPVASYAALQTLVEGLRGVYGDGIKPWKLVSAADVNEQLIKTGPAVLHQVFVSNVTGAAAWLKLYDLAAAPVAGTDVPVMVIDTRTVVGSVVFSPALRYGRGLGMAITAVVDDNDATAVGAGDVVLTVVVE